MLLLPRMLLFQCVAFFFAAKSSIDAAAATKTGSTVNQFQAKLRQQHCRHTVINTRAMAKIKRATRKRQTAKKDAENKMHLNCSLAKRSERRTCICIPKQ